MNKILIAFTSGLIFGILYAPAKGKHTRAKIANAGTDLKEGWNDITSRITGKIDAVKESFDDAADQAVMTIEETQFHT